jgi:hypothetical protein
MAAEQFMVETYGVVQAYDATGPMAVLTVYGPLVGGVRKSAQLYFSPSVTGFVGQHHHPQVFVELPHNAFAGMYDLLRHEAPVYVFYTYAVGSTDLDIFALHTNSVELPGEGPTDANAVQSLMHSWAEGLPRRA